MITDGAAAPAPARPPSILELLAEGGAEDNPAPVTVDELSAHLREHYIGNEDEKERQNRARLLGLYYNAVGDSELESLIGDVFKDKELVEKRQQWVRRAKHCNVLRRVVREKSTAYAEPARRVVADAVSQDRYAELLRRCSFDHYAIEVNRQLNLHWTVAVGFRVRLTGAPGGPREPVVDIVTPDRFFAVCHPTDKTRLIALIIKLEQEGPRVTGEAAWLCWTAAESFRLTATGHVMKETWKENPFGRIPFVLVNINPATTTLVEPWVNEDLRSAHEAVWFEHVCLLKESKSATKVIVLAGDVTAMSRGQALDTEGALTAPDGSAVQVVDMSMDLKMFVDTAESVFDTASANHGIAPQIRKHAGVQSAEARDLLRVPLREIRIEQQTPLRMFERAMAELMAIVCALDLPELAFQVLGWRLDFGDYQTPLSRREQNEVFEKERQLGLTSTPKEMVRRNPDLDIDGALEELAENVMHELARQLLMKPLMALSGQQQGDPRDAIEGEEDEDEDGDQGGKPGEPRG